VVAESINHFRLGSSMRMAVGLHGLLPSLTMDRPPHGDLDYLDYSSHDVVVFQDSITLIILKRLSTYMYEVDHFQFGRVVIEIYTIREATR
jgi:hypothetical protein